MDAWWPSSVPPLAYMTPWGENPRKRGVSEFRRRLVAETYREEKSISGRQIPLGRSPPGRGDHRHRHHHRHGHHRDHHQHHPNISTISIYIPSHLTIATCVVLSTIYPLYSVGVDYYFVVNAIEFCWRNTLCPDCLSPIYHL